MANGGVRPGAGRKSKAELYAGDIRATEQYIVERLPSIVEKQYELSQGIKCSELTKDGIVVYDRPPDRQAAAYLIDRILGRPTERLEVDDASGMSDEALLEAIAARLAGDGGGSISAEAEDTDRAG
jgi:hypothetical protein